MRMHTYPCHVPQAAICARSCVVVCVRCRCRGEILLERACTFRSIPWRRAILICFLVGCFCVLQCIIFNINWAHTSHMHVHLISQRPLTATRSRAGNAAPVAALPILWQSKPRAWRHTAPRARRRPPARHLHRGRDGDGPTLLRAREPRLREWHLSLYTSVGQPRRRGGRTQAVAGTARDIAAI